MSLDLSSLAGCLVSRSLSLTHSIYPDLSHLCLDLPCLVRLTSPLAHTRPARPVGNRPIAQHKLTHTITRTLVIIIINHNRNRNRTYIIFTRSCTRLVAVVMISNFKWLDGTYLRISIWNHSSIRAWDTWNCVWGEVYERGFHHFWRKCAKKLTIDACAQCGASQRAHGT